MSLFKVQYSSFGVGIHFNCRFPVAHECSACNVMCVYLYMYSTVGVCTVQNMIFSYIYFPAYTSAGQLYNVQSNILKNETFFCSPFKKYIFYSVHYSLCISTTGMEWEGGGGGGNKNRTYLHNISQAKQVAIEKG